MLKVGGLVRLCHHHHKFLITRYSSYIFFKKDALFSSPQERHIKHNFLFKNDDVLFSNTIFLFKNSAGEMKYNQRRTILSIGGKSDECTHVKVFLCIKLDPIF